AHRAMARTGSASEHRASRSRRSSVKCPASRLGATRPMDTSVARPSRWASRSVKRLTPPARAARNPPSCTSSRLVANPSAPGRPGLPAPGAELRPRAKARRRREVAARLGDRPERAIQLVEEPLAEAAREPLARQPQHLAQGPGADCAQRLERAVLAVEDGGR